MAPSRSFPKLGLPAQRRPSAVSATPKAVNEVFQDQPYAATIYDIAMQELQRLGADAAKAGRT